MRAADGGGQERQLYYANSMVREEDEVPETGDAGRQHSGHQEAIDEWFVYRHTLDETLGRKPILERSKTLLHVTPGPMGFRAEFNKHGKEGIALDLRQNLLDSPSYLGHDNCFVSRLVVVENRGQNLRALIGHISRVRKSKDDPFERDFFIATREERTARPVISGTLSFDDRIKIPLLDHRSASRADAISLSNDEVVIERHSYRIELEPDASGGMEIRTKGHPEGSRVGGLVLPMAPGNTEQHLLVVAYHHVHTQERHRGHEDERSGVAFPGNPLCTDMFGAIQML